MCWVQAAQLVLEAYCAVPHSKVGSRSPVLGGEVHRPAVPAQHCAAVAHIGDDDLVTPHQGHCRCGARQPLILIVQPCSACSTTVAPSARSTMPAYHETTQWDMPRGCHRVQAPTFQLLEQQLICIVEALSKQVSETHGATEAGTCVECCVDMTHHFSMSITN